MKKQKIEELLREHKEGKIYPNEMRNFARRVKRKADKYAKMKTGG